MPSSHPKSNRSLGRAGRKAPLTARVIAKWIDLGIVFTLAALPIYPLGPLSGFFYSLFCDGFSFGPFRSQSIGKWIFRLQVENIKTRRPIGLQDSAIRNVPVGVATFFAIIPLWGWIILALVGMPLLILEVYLMLTAERGRRLGDVMGDTEVVPRPSQEKDSLREPQLQKRTPPADIL